MNKSQLLKTATKYVKDFLDKPSKLPKIVIILGPTASGKTGLSIELAKIFKGEIISADSRQVWKDFDIGTAKVTPAEAQNIPHHLIDIVNPDSQFTLWDWKTQAEKIISDLTTKKILPIIAGGTGLFTDALIDNFHIPTRDPDLRIKLEKEWNQDQGKTLHQKLQKLSPEAAKNLSPASKHHLIRTTEIALQNQTKAKGPKKFDSLILGLKWDPEKLRTRIKLRTKLMLQDGLISETQNLLKNWPKNSTPFNGIGHKEVVTFLEDKISESEMQTQITTHTSQFAKRQRTWWRRRSDIIWLNCN